MCPAPAEQLYQVAHKTEEARCAAADIHARASLKVTGLSGWGWGGGHADFVRPRRVRSRAGLSIAIPSFQEYICEHTNSKMLERACCSVQLHRIGPCQSLITTVGHGSLCNVV
jgi:hypothetical protein